MIGRLGALADIVGPAPAVRPAAAGAWLGMRGWLLLGVLAIAGAALLLPAARAMRRRLARRRLRMLSGTLRAHAPERDVAALLPRVWSELRRAGVPAPQAWPAPARVLRQRLLYARRAQPDVLRALLDELLGR